jgi:pectin methylesterase-like acyl-CoA thioesterase
VLTNRNHSEKGGQSRWKSLVLVVVSALYFASISLHQLSDGSSLDAQNLTATAQLSDSGLPDHDQSVLSGECGARFHCHSVAILSSSAPSHEHPMARPIFTTKIFVKQQILQFPAPPPKSA